MKVMIGMPWPWPCRMKNGSISIPCQCHSWVKEMISINLDAGLRPVSFYPADDVVSVAVSAGDGEATGGL